MDRYPNISDHGLIGDLQTAALVTTEGTIDFFCCPRFDSPSIVGTSWRSPAPSIATTGRLGTRADSQPQQA